MGQPALSRAAVSISHHAGLKRELWKGGSKGRGIKRKLILCRKGELQVRKGRRGRIDNCVLTGDSYRKRGVSSALIIKTSPCVEQGLLTGRLMCDQYTHTT